VKFTGVRKNWLKIWQHNVQGLKSKIMDYDVLLHELDLKDSSPDVLLLCETFLNDQTVNKTDLKGY